MWSMSSQALGAGCSSASVRAALLVPPTCPMSRQLVVPLLLCRFPTSQKTFRIFVIAIFTQRKLETAPLSISLGE